MSDRRAFLRSLASLPLIAPTAAVVPVTDELLWGYKGWLANEHKMLCGEMTGYDAAKMQALHHLFYNAHPASDWHFEWPNPGYRLAGWIDAPQPSTRAAVVLSAAGVGLG